MSRRTVNVLVSLLLLLSIAANVPAADQRLELAAPFTDNMILQRQKVVPVWGLDAPGASVTVEFAGQKSTCVADKHGDWMVKLNPLKVSHTERTFKVTNNNSESIVLSGVLVGEVWFSSGQSNMVWLAGQSMCSGIAREIAGSKEDIPMMNWSAKDGMTNDRRLIPTAQFREADIKGGGDLLTQLGCFEIAFGVFANKLGVEEPVKDLAQFMFEYRLADEPPSSTKVIREFTARYHYLVADEFQDLGS